MNERFKEYVTSGAFTLSLSKRMIEVLVHIGQKTELTGGLNLAPYFALERRGLITNPHQKGWDVTEEGKIVIDLLMLSGFCQEQLKDKVAA